MSQPPPASISSRSAVWLLLLWCVVFAPAQARASFTRTTFQTPEVIARSLAPQVAGEPRFKLEIGTGIVCGNDPVNRHDPLGLAEMGRWEYDPASGVFGFVSDYNRYYFGKNATLNGQAQSPLFAHPIDQPSVALGGRSMTMAFGSEGARALYGGAELFSSAAIGMTPLGPYIASRGATENWMAFSEMEPGDLRTLTGMQAGIESLGALLYVAGPMAAMGRPGGVGASPMMAERSLLSGRGSNWMGRQRFDSSALSSAQIDSAILRSIRRKSGATGTPSGQIAASSDQVEFILNKATYWRRNFHAADEELALLPANLKGTIVHGSVATKMRQLNIEGLAVNQRLYGTSQFVSPVTNLPYAFRIPDYRMSSTILDIKPVGTPLSGPQVIDFMNFGNTRDVRFIFYEPW